jgi:hypothetical protein
LRWNVSTLALVIGPSGQLAARHGIDFPSIAIPHHALIGPLDIQGDDPTGMGKAQLKRGRKPMRAPY